MKYNYKRLAEDIKKHIGYEGSNREFALKTGLKESTVANLLKGDRDYKQSTVMKAVYGIGSKLDDYVE
jgi:predicted transcriptional regulator